MNYLQSNFVLQVCSEESQKGAIQILKLLIQLLNGLSQLKKICQAVLFFISSFFGSLILNTYSYTTCYFRLNMCNITILCLFFWIYAPWYYGFVVILVVSVFSKKKKDQIMSWPLQCILLTCTANHAKGIFESHCLQKLLVVIASLYREKMILVLSVRPTPIILYYYVQDLCSKRCFTAKIIQIASLMVSNLL